MNELEKYLRENRAKLDHIEEPAIEAIWENIKEEITPQASIKSLPSNNWQLNIGRNWRWVIAASFALLISLMVWNTQNQQQNTLTLASIAEFYPELAEQEKNYQQLISQKEKAIGLSKIDKMAFQEIFQELELLEQIHREYLKDLPRYNFNDQLVKTLIKYYERKIQILERLSREIEKKTHHENRNQEKFL